LLNIINSNIPVDSMWYRKSNFFTLLCEIYFLDLTIENVIGKLSEFEENVMANKSADKSANDFALYYSNMYTGTNSRSARVNRSELLKKYIV